jgi:hypothetical protein
MGVGSVVLRSRGNPDTENMMHYTNSMIPVRKRASERTETERERERERERLFKVPSVTATVVIHILMKQMAESL